MTNKLKPKNTCLHEFEVTQKGGFSDTAVFVVL